MKLATPKGFRDFLPAEALKRKFVLEKITEVFEKFGFDPLETPTLEYEETLTGKYGEEEKLIYKFETPGGDKVALKYDQTVPLARVIAQYGPNGEQKLSIPFKRYQIQSAYRGENTQKGRYREFLQCDADIVGVSTPLADAEILGLTYEVYKNLRLEVVIKINDRAQINDIEPKYLNTMDKLLKIGEEDVIIELQNKGLTYQEARDLFDRIIMLKPSENLLEIMKLYKHMGYPESSLEFDPTLMRGLDYYTGIIMEAVLKSDPTSPSLGGGGRWDQMIGKFTGNDLPASGYSIGLERTTEAMGEAGLLPSISSNTEVLITIFSPELQDKQSLLLRNKSMEALLRLRSANISSEIYLDPETKLDKQLKYADQKGIPYVVIIGPDEASSDQVTLRDLTNKTQEKLSVDELVSKLGQ